MITGPVNMQEIFRLSASEGCNVHARPSEADGALQPRSTGLWPSGVALPSDSPYTPEEKERIDKAFAPFDGWSKAVADLNRQLAEARAALEEQGEAEGDARSYARDMEAENKQLQAVLDRERELHANTTNQCVIWAGRMEKEREARLRAEARAASARLAVKSLLDEAEERVGRRMVIANDGLTQQFETDVRRFKEALRAIDKSTDTGARLAAVVSEEMKKPCQFLSAERKNECRKVSPRFQEEWCLRCRLVDAMETTP
jgi:hypothetical protein